MQDKLELLKEIKELWNNQNIDKFDIAPELLEYLEEKDLIKLKEKILTSLKELTQEQKEWLSKFKKEA